MDFLISVRGSHSEGVESTHRLHAIVAKFRDDLTANGFLHSDVFVDADHHEAATEPPAPEPDAPATTTESEPAVVLEVKPKRSHKKKSD